MWSRVWSWTLWHRRRKEHKLEVLRQQQQQVLRKGASEEGDIVSLDPALLDQLRNLGLLVDVEQLIQEMDSASYHPLPSLEGLSVKNGYFLSPKNEISLCEILELIFSYLDDNTVCHSAVLVCRQWRLLSQGRLLREVYWQEDWNSSRKQRAALRLPGAARLYCCLPFYTEEENNGGKNTICHFLAQLEAQYQKQLAHWKHRSAPNRANHNKQPSTLWSWKTTAQPRTMPTLFNFAPLRELHIFLDFNHGKPFNTLTFPRSLTTLSIVIRFAFYSEFDLSRILRSCTLLENLLVETYETPGVTLTWATPFVSTTAITPTSANLTTGLPLRSLVLSHVMLAQPYLENLLPHTPDLKELKLKGMMGFCTGKYDWTRLASCLRTNSIILDNAHFSMSDTEMMPEEIEHFLTEVHSQSTRELTLWARDTSRSLPLPQISSTDTSVNLITLYILRPSRLRFIMRIWIFLVEENILAWARIWTTEPWTSSSTCYQLPLPLPVLLLFLKSGVAVASVHYTSTFSVPRSTISNVPFKVGLFMATSPESAHFSRNCTSVSHKKIDTQGRVVWISRQDSVCLVG
ncbi:hypothetical protein BGZ96_009128 [Linnemannia gamsii]|uniref:F-box domain-containing protein n=1 Tax=Linnemannia gamsii TaxID=64522 RepID=A0ABQ7KDF0_9FUNG|nr:hypothetical protein BGZ96_009128 [Linnemannia gamsii]